VRKVKSGQLPAVEEASQGSQPVQHFQGGGFVQGATQPPQPAFPQGATEPPQPPDAPTGDVFTPMPQETGEPVQPPSLSDMRAPYAQQLQDPRVRQRVIASIAAETEDQSPAVKLGYIESIMNRGLARNRNLLDVVNDPGYYPKVTRDQLGRTFTDQQAQPYMDLINKALAGSNTTNFATGNESKNVHSGEVTWDGKKVGKRGDYERFVAEPADVSWRNQLLDQRMAQAR
jgi:hypothetical protein